VNYVVLPFYKYFLRPGKNLKKYGQWAVVTGATDGIGLAMSHELARKGLNIVLISRSQDKLNQAAAEITEKSKVQVKTLSVDFSNWDAASKENVRSTLRALDVGVLVNNVGMSYANPEFFDQLDEATLKQMIDLNVNSTTYMTHAILPSMVERKRGAIVNISSAASLLTNPLLAHYSATKSFMDKLSCGLNAEYSAKGINVQVQNPLYVTSKLSKIRKASLTTPSPSGYARAAVRFIGYDAQCSPYWVHALMLTIMSWLPESLLTKQVMGQHLSIRKRAMQKKAAAGAQ